MFNTLLHFVIFAYHAYQHSKTVYRISFDRYIYASVTHGGNKNTT